MVQTLIAEKIGVIIPGDLTVDFETFYLELSMGNAGRHLPVTSGMFMLPGPVLRSKDDDIPLRLYNTLVWYGMPYEKGKKFERQMYEDLKRRKVVRDLGIASYDFRDRDTVLLVKEHVFLYTGPKVKSGTIVLNGGSTVQVMETNPIHPTTSCYYLGPKAKDLTEMLGKARQIVKEIQEWQERDRARKQRALEEQQEAERKENERRQQELARKQEQEAEQLNARQEQERKEAEQKLQQQQEAEFQQMLKEEQERKEAEQRKREQEAAAAAEQGKTAPPDNAEAEEDEDNTPRQQRARAKPRQPRKRKGKNRK